MLLSYPTVGDDLKKFMESYGFELQQSDSKDDGSYWEYRYKHVPDDERRITVRMGCFPPWNAELNLGHILTAIEEASFDAGRCRQASEMRDALNYGNPRGHGHPLHQLDM